LSHVPLAETWGLRYFKYPAGQPKLSSVNPYRLLSVHDDFGPEAHLDNPPVPPAELRTVTIIGLHRPESAELPKWSAEFLKRPNNGNDFLIETREWLPGVENQMRAFYNRAGHDFRLAAPQHAEIRVRLSGLRLSAGDGSFKAFGAQIVPEDKAKLVPGVGYSIVPINTNQTYRWVVAPDVPPLRVKD
jgi:hypothetical protein